jgi:hypothetical protein
MGQEPYFLQNFYLVLEQDATNIRAKILNKYEIFGSIINIGVVRKEKI